jgi:hypothetical protein
MEQANEPQRTPRAQRKCGNRDDVSWGLYKMEMANQVVENVQGAGRRLFREKY